MKVEFFTPLLGISDSQIVCQAPRTQISLLQSFLITNEKGQVFESQKFTKSNKNTFFSISKMASVASSGAGGLGGAGGGGGPNGSGGNFPGGRDCGGGYEGNYGRGNRKRQSDPRFWKPKWCHICDALGSHEKKVCWSQQCYKCFHYGHIGPVCASK